MAVLFSLPNAILDVLIAFYITNHKAKCAIFIASSK